MRRRVGGWGAAAAFPSLGGHADVNLLGLGGLGLGHRQAQHAVLGEAFELSLGGLGNDGHALSFSGPGDQQFNAEETKRNRPSLEVKKK